MDGMAGGLTPERRAIVDIGMRAMVVHRCFNSLRRDELGGLVPLGENPRGDTIGWAAPAAERGRR